MPGKALQIKYERKRSMRRSRIRWFMLCTGTYQEERKELKSNLRRSVTGRKQRLDTFRPSTPLQNGSNARRNNSSRRRRIIRMAP
jgi:hypothetical protein